jgi:DNA-binding NarL/FixJ family response regulator
MHRQDVVAMMKSCRPHLIVLDMYVAEPSGAAVLETFRAQGYVGRVVMLSGPSMMSVLDEVCPNGVDAVVRIPEKIAGHYDCGELIVAIEMSLKRAVGQPAEDIRRAHIAQRAHELFEEGGRQNGSDVHDWLRAEQEYLT